MLKNPNHILWQRYADYGENRGDLVVEQISRFINISKCCILDLGCGKGGISTAFANHGAKIVSADVSHLAWGDGKNYMQNPNHFCVQTRAEASSFKASTFDLVLLNDVLEHLLDPEAALENITEALKPCGSLWISTPNRWSPANLICDPHYSLPVLAALPRPMIKKIVAEWLKWHPEEKRDHPELWSFNRLVDTLQRWNYNITFVNKNVAQYGFEKPESIWSRPLHIALAKKAKNARLDHFILKFIRDDNHWINRWIQPTWYLVATVSENHQDRYE
jgi:SAM-dependent methyltransferase